MIYLLISESEDRERQTVFYAYNNLADAIKWVEDVDPCEDPWEDNVDLMRMFCRRRTDYPGTWKIMVMEPK